jgi:hypothetical protein
MDGIETRREADKRDPRWYFVDEAGDAVLFARRGRVIVGTEGCSRFFILGLLDVAEPEALARELTELRVRLIADPYFADVPSMQPDAGKTAEALHAKDDVPEVRREVFALLQKHEVKFLAVVRDKLRLVEDVRELNRWNDRYRYNPNDLYDDMVKRLFRDKLHKGDEICVHFAVRGNRPRTASLKEALGKARAARSRRRGTGETVRIIAGRPADHPCLQAADYFLWSLQRLYERGEERFVKLLWDNCSVVMDVDDKRGGGTGVYYNRVAGAVARPSSHTTVRTVPYTAVRGELDR